MATGAFQPSSFAPPFQSAAGTIVPPVAPTETPAGRGRRTRNIFRVRIDGQTFEFKSLADAIGFLEEAKAAAKKLALVAANEAAKKQEASPQLIELPALKPPKIEINTRDLRGAVSKTRADIEEIYRAAYIDAQIRLLFALKQRREQEDDDMALILTYLDS